MNPHAPMTFPRPAPACEATHLRVRAWIERRLDERDDATRDYAAEDRAAELIDMKNDRSGRNDYGHNKDW